MSRFKHSGKERASAPDTTGFQESQDDKHRIEEVIGEVGGGYWDLIDRSSNLVQSVLPDGHYFYVNQAWCQILGYSADEAKQMTFLDALHPDCHEHCMRIFGKLQQGSHYEKVECDFLAKSGTKVPAEGDVSCYFEGERPIATRGVFRVVAVHAGGERELLDAEPAAEEVDAQELFLAFKELVEP
ncbi:MAG: PAS domain S-box protein [Candidatus Geothermincolia bacterium]